MGSGVSGWFRRVLGRDDKPPAEPPAGQPQPPQAQVPLLGLQGQRKPVVIWLERRHSRDADAMIGQYGLSAIRDIVVCGGDGVSVYGRTLRVLHGNADPMPPNAEAWFKERGKGCYGLALDWEGWSQEKRSRGYVLDMIHKVPTWLAPQLGFAYGNPRYPIFGQSHDETVKDCDGAELLLWQYGSSAEQWLAEMRKVRAAGFRGVMVAMTDGGRREGEVAGHNTVAECVRVVNMAADQSIGVGLFMPQLNPAKIKPVLDAIVARYGVNAVVVNPPIPTPEPPAPRPPLPQPPQSTTPRVSGTRIIGASSVLRPVLDTAWQIVEKCNDISGYLDIRKAQGFNGIILGSDGAWYDGDVAKPVRDRFIKAQDVLDRLRARGMSALVVVQLQQYDSNGRCVVRVSPSQAEALGRDFATRFVKHDAVLGWMVGGLDEVAQGVHPAVPDAIAKGVRSVDPVRPIMYHPKAREASTDRLPLSDHCDIVAYQSYNISTYTAIMADYQRSVQSGKPWCMIEGPYEDNAGITSEDVVRAQTTASKVNPCIMAFGNLTVCVFKSGWQDRLNSVAARGFIQAANQYWR